MHTLSISYTYKYCILFSRNYVFTNCGLCVNLRTNRKIKKIYNNGSIGYSINGKFYSLTFLRKHLEKVPKKEQLPF